jgi:predicted Fe-Mo cluster-binding NifX family protein
MITIAIPSTEGRLHGHFGGCREFTFVQADPDTKKIIKVQALIPPEHVPGAFPRWVREQGASVIIAGGIGRRALDLFAEQGIQVRAGLPDAPVEQLATAYLNGQLTAAPEGCKHHGHHHDHEHHHDGHGHHHHGHGDAGELAH